MAVTKRVGPVQKPGGIKIQIPFAGFYHTIHAYEIDSAVENLVSDDNGSPHEALLDKVRALIDFSAVESKYAKEYAEDFPGTFDLSAASGEPTEICSYDYSAWDVFVTFDRDSAAEIVRATRCRVGLSSLMRRIGAGDFDTGDFARPLRRWCHETWRVALLVYIDARSSHHDPEGGAVEGWSGNGVVDSWLFDTLPEDKRAELNRLCAVAARVQRRDYGDHRPTCKPPVESLPLFAYAGWQPDVGELADLRGVNGHGAKLALRYYHADGNPAFARAAFDKMADLTSLGCRTAALCLWAWQKWLAVADRKVELVHALAAQASYGADPESVLGWRV